MPTGGVFITLYDEETLKLYLARGVYGFLMKPIRGQMSSRSKHYNALGDYACVREDTHIFFFQKRKIVYGGQALGSKKYGAFYLNGAFSLLGEKAKAPVSWNEGERGKYLSTRTKGMFSIEKGKVRCQPYLIRFKDRIGIAGNWILSDQLYWELGKYPFPLPSNSISGMGFCTLTPGETNIALKLLKVHSKGSYPCVSKEEIRLEQKICAFRPKYGISSIKRGFQRKYFVNEAHLEAFVLANPQLLPKFLQPNATDVLCRQVPMSPFKPSDMDRANICYYTRRKIREGMLPNKILELKVRKVVKKDVGQVVRYLRWLEIALEGSKSNTKIYLCGPEFSRNIARFIPEEYRNQIKLYSLI